MMNEREAEPLTALALRDNERAQQRLVAVELKADEPQR